MYHGPLRTTTPPTRINDDLVLTQEHHQLLNTHAYKFRGQTYQHTLIQGNCNDPQTEFVAPFLLNSLVYVITETVGEYPYPYFSEKTRKAMLTKMPFMIVSSQHSLKKLKSFGFQTFDRWWCEDYDQLPIAADRISAVVGELKKLSTMDAESLRLVKTEMACVTHHNLHQLRLFKTKDLDNLQKNI